MIPPGLVALANLELIFGRRAGVGNGQDPRQEQGGILILAYIGGGSTGLGWLADEAGWGGMGWDRIQDAPPAH